MLDCIITETIITPHYHGVILKELKGHDHFPDHNLSNILAIYLIMNFTFFPFQNSRFSNKFCIGMVLLHINNT